MPADITGTHVPDYENQQSQKFVFQKGPIFTNLLLADEINRATPKTQSAMLEAMAEKQVTVLRTERRLNLPFMVLATQNPIDHEGTYNLPEAQADRFMFKILMPVPGNDSLDRIIEKSLKVESGAPGKESNEERKDQSYFDEINKYILTAGSHKLVKQHIINIVLASNHQFEELRSIDKNKRIEVERLVDLMHYGLGPRAAQMLMRGAVAWSLMFEERADVGEWNGLANVMIATLLHRIKFIFGWEDKYKKMKGASDKKNSRDYWRISFIRDFCLSLLPAQFEIRPRFENTLNAACKRFLNLER
jgi:MoxR-like ATPase